MHGQRQCYGTSQTMASGLDAVAGFEVRFDSMINTFSRPGKAVMQAYTGMFIGNQLHIQVYQYIFHIGCTSHSNTLCFGIVVSGQKVEDLYFRDAAIVGEGITLGRSHLANSRFCLIGGIGHVCK